MKPTILGLIIGVLLLSGCQGNLDQFDGGKLWNEFGKTELPAIVGSAVGWTVLGVVGGILLAVGAFFLFRRFGWYSLPGTAGKVLRVLILLFMLVVLPVLGGGCGYAEGILRGVNHALKESSLAKEWLPKGGEACADAVAILDRLMSALEGQQAQENLLAFQAGQEGIDIPRFMDRIDKLKAGAAQELASKVRQRILDNHPDWRGGKGEAILDWLLPRLTVAIVERGVKARLDKVGIQPFFQELSTAADQQDQQGNMRRPALAQFFTDEVIRPSLLQSVRVPVRTAQKGIVIGILLVLIVPVALMKLLAAMWKPVNQAAR